LIWFKRRRHRVAPVVAVASLRHGFAVRIKHLTTSTDARKSKEACRETSTARPTNDQELWAEFAAGSWRTLLHMQKRADAAGAGRTLRVHSPDGSTCEVMAAI